MNSGHSELTWPNTRFFAKASLRNQVAGWMEGDEKWFVSFEDAKEKIQAFKDMTTASDGTVSLYDIAPNKLLERYLLNQN